VTAFIHDLFKKVPKRRVFDLMMLLRGSNERQIHHDACPLEHLIIVNMMD
jgi:hypothetical protein